MRYSHTVKGRFLSRPNRFIAHVEVEGEVQICHVKNTGRCRELLLPGATVILEKSQNPNRRTAYDLVAVYKGETLINMDSQAPNAVLGEWLQTTDYFGKLTKIQPECSFGSSRFDFYLETAEQKIFAEVKGVTLEKDGVVSFPDAPTQLGVKHIYVLIEAKKQGYGAYLFFVVQMQHCTRFEANRRTDPAFADALEQAKAAGVTVCVLTCHTREDLLEIDTFLTPTEG
ncbi:MAG: DNA/RNA nuclease SfsA [Clostridia bacterium]|nr:DNA/RNA nuclease SfsA [Clostridia bacterium]